MRIISTFLPAVFDAEFGKKTILMAFDTLIDDKSVVIGITVGRLDGPTLDDVMVGAIGQKIITRLAGHHKLNYPQTSPVVIAGVQSVSNAVHRVRNVLRNVPDKSVLLFVCSNDKVYDAAFTALGVDFKSADMQAQ